MLHPSKGDLTGFQKCFHPDYCTSVYPKQLEERLEKEKGTPFFDEYCPLGMFGRTNTRDIRATLNPHITIAFATASACILSAEI